MNFHKQLSFPILMLEHNPLPLLLNFQKQIPLSPCPSITPQPLAYEFSEANTSFTPSLAYPSKLSPCSAPWSSNRRPSIPPSPLFPQRKLFRHLFFQRRRFRNGSSFPLASYGNFCLKPFQPFISSAGFRKKTVVFAHW